MSFSFGTAAQQPAASGGFGGFGQPATSTPAAAGGFGSFGQTSTAPTSTPFGQPAATSTPFGQQPATSTPFGQTATSTPFGQAPTSTPATGGFGGFGQAATATSTPFGQQPGTSTAFGQAPTSTAATSGFGGFGQATTTPAPFGQTSSAFSFNSTPATSAPTSSFGFGNTTSGGGLFGSTAAKPSFGLTTNTPFGAAKPGLNQQQQRDQQIYQLLSQVETEAKRKVNPIASKDYKPTTAWACLAQLKAWWDPTSPYCQFKHYFYNVVPPQEVQLYIKPENHDAEKWKEAQEQNPDPTTLVPALAIGFDDVQKRIDQQHKLSEAHANKIADLQALLEKIQKTDMVNTATRLEEYKRRHMETAQRVIKFLKYTQVLRNKGLSITPDEEVMRTRLENIQEELQRSEQFHGKLSQLWAQLQLIKESGRKYSKTDSAGEWAAVSESEMLGITKILEEQENGVQHIIEVINKDANQVDMISKGWRG